MSASKHYQPTDMQKFCIEEENNSYNDLKLSYR